MVKEPLDTRGLILKTALQLFMKKGYKDVTYRDLIEKTGLSKGAIYHHFVSKQDLLANVFDLMLKVTRQTISKGIEGDVKDVESFRKLFIKSKLEQINDFKKMMGNKSLQINKLLFFLEAINENRKLNLIIEDLMQQELNFLEKCFEELKRHKQLSKGKDPKKIAGCLFSMLQSVEMRVFLKQGIAKEEDFVREYNKTIADFFEIL